MLRPKEYNNFNSSKHLFAYLNYLNEYLTSIEMFLNFKRKFIDSKLHIDISITDSGSKDVVFNQTVKVVDSDSYTYFDNSIYEELFYYAESKKLTLEHVNDDGYSILNFKRITDFSDNFTHIIKKRRMDFANKRRFNNSIKQKELIAH